MIRAEETVLMGMCTKTHGKQGEVQVRTDRDWFSEATPAFVVFELDHILTPFRLLSWREKGADAYLLRLAGIDSEERALRLCGHQAYLLRRDFTDDPSDPLLTWDDLVGFEVVDEAGERLGTITQIDDSTLNTLMMLDDGTILPAHEDLILEIQADIRQLTLSLPEGLRNN